ncbi:YdcF family protein [Undibacterium sp. Jales W-56]|uniref:YdcF family protein n=1 Tax=Undibacterium sp. Jales W-56 TaxID=2897325 RepID=UPI0021D04AB9|nr:YdcF family protein [Undibacterium sp. Jales W-56]MCU6432539.1 YdcF family protein [Undibacterium sp. Jales W-56]
MHISVILATFAKILVLPPFSLFLIYLIGMLLSQWRPRLGQILRISAVFLLFFISTGFGSWLLVRPLESLEAALSSGKNTQADAIVILTAGRVAHSPEYNGQDIPDHIALARIRYGAHLYHATGLPILVTGGLGQDSGNTETLAAGMQRALEQDFLIPVQWAENHARNTEENARYSAAILKPAGVKRILLVTDAMHMRRARIAFERSGLQVVPAPTMFLADSEGESWNLFATAENMRRSHYALYEWLGLLRYRIESLLS